MQIIYALWNVHCCQPCRWFQFSGQRSIVSFMFYLLAILLFFRQLGIDILLIANGVLFQLDRKTSPQKVPPSSW
jgi:hypothetical protein